MHTLSRAVAAAAVVVAASVGLAGCGGDSTAEAEQSAATYFSAPNTGQWGEAVRASTGIAQSRALFYDYAAPITGLPSGTLFASDPTQVVTVSIDDLKEADGVLRATGTMSGDTDLATVDFAKTDDGVKVADYLEFTGLPLSAFFAPGESVDSGGGLTLSVVAGRMTRTTSNTVPSYQWISVVQNENSWPVSVDSIRFTPSAGGAPVTWVPGQAASETGSTIAAQEQAPPGRTASIWVRQAAKGTTEGGGTVSVTLSGAGTGRELSVELPRLTPPPGWSTAP